MPVHFVAEYISSHVPSEYYAALGASMVASIFLKTWARGPSLLDLSEDLADLHGRVVLVATGAFTPVGLVVMSALAHRGAQVVALTPSLRSLRVHQLVSLLRDGSGNPLIYAEACDTSSLASITAFCDSWNAGQSVPAGGAQSGVRRLDTLLFLEDDTPVLNRFHLLNALLPSLLLLPPEHDVRIVSVLSPLYAVGMHEKGSRWTMDGSAALEWYVLTCEMQRRLDLLAEADPRPRDKLPGIDKAQPNHRKSNISVIDVCTGFERNNHVLNYLLPPSTQHDVQLEDEQTEKPQRTPSKADEIKAALEQLQPSTEKRWEFTTALRYLLAVLLWPLIWLLAKSPASSSDAIVWAITKPISPLRGMPPNLTTKEQRKWSLTQPLQPAELYREGRVVRPVLPPAYQSSSAPWHALWASYEAQAPQQK